MNNNSQATFRPTYQFSTFFILWNWSCFNNFGKTRWFSLKNSQSWFVRRWSLKYRLINFAVFAWMFAINKQLNTVNPTIHYHRHPDFFFHLLSSFFAKLSFQFPSCEYYSFSYRPPFSFSKKKVKKSVWRWREWIDNRSKD